MTLSLLTFTLFFSCALLTGNRTRKKLIHCFLFFSRSGKKNWLNKAGRKAVKKSLFSAYLSFVLSFIFFSRQANRSFLYLHFLNNIPCLKCILRNGVTRNTKKKVYQKYNKYSENDI